MTTSLLIIGTAIFFFFLGFAVGEGEIFRDIDQLRDMRRKMGS